MGHRINILSMELDQLVELMEVNGLDPSTKHINAVVKEFNLRFDWHNGSDDLLDAIDAIKEEVVIRRALKLMGLPIAHQQRRDIDNMVALLQDPWVEELTAHHGREQAIVTLAGQYVADRPEGGYKATESY